MQHAEAMDVDDDSDLDVPESVIRPKGASLTGKMAATHHPEIHHLPDRNPDTDSDGDGNLMGDFGGAGPSIHGVMHQRANADEKMRDQRGSYLRTATKGQKTGYEQLAYEHKVKAESFNFGKPCLANCIYKQKCGLNIAPYVLLNAHYHAYGTNSA